MLNPILNPLLNDILKNKFIKIIREQVNFNVYSGLASGVTILSNTYPQKD